MNPAVLATRLADLARRVAKLERSGGGPGGPVSWGSVTGKPSTFPPSSHTHPWGEVTGKPTEFPPSAHTHPVSDVIGLTATLSGKSRGILPWSAGTYLPGEPAIYAGSLYAARVETTDAPIVSAALGGPVSTVPGEWHLNSTGTISTNVDAGTETVSLMNGTASSPSSSALIEDDTHTGWVGMTLTTQARVADPTGTTATRGLALGIIDAAKGTTPHTLLTSGSGFWGAHITPSGLYIVADGTLTQAGANASGQGLFDWASIGVAFTPTDGGVRIAVTKDGAAFYAATVSAPLFSTYRIAYGSRLASGSATASYHQVRHTPTLGVQSDDWRRICAVADLT